MGGTFVGWDFSGRTDPSANKWWTHEKNLVCHCGADAIHSLKSRAIIRSFDSELNELDPDGEDDPEDFHTFCTVALVSYSTRR